MVLDLRVETPDPPTARITAVLEQTFRPETRGPDDESAFFSDSFVSRHTAFESFEEFCRACPAEQDTVGGLQRLPADERNEFVAANSDFETWSAMKRNAAVTDLVTLQIG